MSTIIPVIVIIIASTIEGFGQPWPSIVGVSIPLTIIALSIYGQSEQSSKLPWLGLLGGVLLDVSTLNVLGAQALFYFILGWLLGRIAGNDLADSKKRWYQLGIVVVATLLRPGYLALANYQLSQDWSDSLTIALIQSVLVAVIAGAISWYQSKKISI